MCGGRTHRQMTPQWAKGRRAEAQDQNAREQAQLHRRSAPAQARYTHVSGLAPEERATIDGGPRTRAAVSTLGLAAVRRAGMAKVGACAPLSPVSASLELTGAGVGDPGGEVASGVDAADCPSILSTRLSCRSTSCRIADNA